MNSDMIVLKGSMHGKTNPKPYKNPDILSSNVDGKTYEINKLTISLSLLSDKNQFYIYHSYNQNDYSGRWYTGGYVFSPKDMDKEKKTFTIELKSVNWEDFDTGKETKKDVTIIINLTERGYKKLNKYFTHVLDN